MDIGKLLEGLDKRYSATSATITVRMKHDLLTALDKLCKEADTTRSKVIKAALTYYMDTVKNKQE
jgi:metal-responsive CopG/Arc/MetJ family transcriptional regulator